MLYNYPMIEEFTDLHAVDKQKMLQIVILSIYFESQMWYSFWLSSRLK